MACAAGSRSVAGAGVGLASAVRGAPYTRPSSGVGVTGLVTNGQEMSA